MIHVERFRTEHLQLIAAQETELLEDCEPEAIQLAAEQDTISIFVLGELMACGGILVVDGAPPLLWSLMSARSSRCMLTIYRVTKRFIETCGHDQLHSTTPEDFFEGQRFLEMLGFRLIGELPEYIGGQCHLLYVRP